MMTLTTDDLAELKDLERRAVDMLSGPMRPDARAKLLFAEGDCNPEKSFPDNRS